ncbi:MAG: hypothetical protein Q4G30_01480 [Actinomycetaceae bacterium]|nr:hypothetical protein [Actinomycetaceae bacterium]
MFELYIQPMAVIHILIVASLLGVIASLVSTYLGFALRPIAKEIVVLHGSLFVYFALAMLNFVTIAQLKKVHHLPLELPSLGVAALVVGLASLWVLWRNRSWHVLVLMASMLIYIDALAEILGVYYMPVYVAMQVLALTYSLVSLIFVWQKSRSLVTMLSLKNALDRVPDGLLFLNDQGYPILINRQMERIFELLGIHIRGSSVTLWNSIVSRGEVIENNDATQVLLHARLPESEIPDIRPPAWLFTRSELEERTFAMSSGISVQIHATEVSALHELVTLLEAEVLAQEEASTQLRDLLATTDQLARDLAIGSARERLHDLVAHRISIVHRLMEHERHDVQALRAVGVLVDDLRKELASPLPSDPHTAWKIMCDTYKTIGFTIDVEGSLPADNDAAAVFLRLGAEAASNAILHASADTIHVVFADGFEGEGPAEGASMTVTSKGYYLVDEVKEGHGLSSIRARLEEMGGTLNIDTNGSFVLKAVLPK